MPGKDFDQIEKKMTNNCEHTQHERWFCPRLPKSCSGQRSTSITEFIYSSYKMNLFSLYILSSNLIELKYSGWSLFIWSKDHIDFTFFFYHYLNFNFKPMIEIKIFEKIPCHEKNCLLKIENRVRVGHSLTKRSSRRPQASLSDILLRQRRS